MKVEIIIYLYGAVCISMIVFNLVYNLRLKGKEARMEKRRQALKVKIDQQLSRIQDHQEIETAHLKYMERTLSRISPLIALSQILQENYEQDPQLYQAYLDQIYPIILRLAKVYQNKEDMQASYFTYFLSCYTTDTQSVIDSLQEILMEYVKKPNLYCRFNALKALYQFATPESIVHALKLQDDGSVFLHEKLITEGLLSYKGDHPSLIQALLDEFSAFSTHTQLAILNYIRFRSPDYKEGMYRLMVDPEADKELRLAAIRYFGKYAYKPAKKPLIAFVRDKDSSMWEFATVAASSLSAYPSKKTCRVLKEALHSSNWYVRFSAAQSLNTLGLSYSDMIDVMVDNDRYAREMLMYQLESRKLRNS